ncbi:polycomb group RING finger protein 3 isoform X2 [Tamandua tetradactyla]|uniref:polycomb group RING finger protein 3 isoform X2 n=1 Tax=Tamandua tetradactyla TaxID=48850 RepID=UPI004053FF6C
MLTRKIKLWDINAHITCRLCSGYLIDATTVTECLHTFCRSCLVKYLEENNTCPTCRIVIHQSHPLQYIGHDRTMQDIVYKLVPGLQEAEMRKQREFYHKLGMEVPGDIKGEPCSAKQHLDSHRNGEPKADDSSNKGAAEEKQEEDGDYHRSDEQSAKGNIFHNERCLIQSIGGIKGGESFNSQKTRHFLQPASFSWGAHRSPSLDARLQPALQSMDLYIPTVV